MQSESFDDRKRAGASEGPWNSWGELYDPYGNMCGYIAQSKEKGKVSSIVPFSKDYFQRKRYGKLFFRHSSNSY